ncbi:MAG: VOC family protein [Pirellula sp.]|jgi:hypothetical protein|nr:VOC family protein [Pirellula sp.]
MPARDNYSHGEFCWVDLNAHDMSAAKEFYGKLFGWQSVDFDMQGGPPYGGFLLDGKNIAGIGQMSDEMKTQGVPPSWNCYVRVQDAKATEEQAVALGAKVVESTLQITDAGHMAFLADPSGAMFATWQPITHQGSDVWGDDYSPCWCELATWDIEGAKTFYEKVFGWTCNDFPGGPTQYYVANVDATNMTGGLLKMTKEWGDMPSHWSVYFHVPNVDETCAKCTELGGKVCFPPFDASVGRMAGCTDPQGAFFYVIKLNPME